MSQLEGIVSLTRGQVVEGWLRRINQRLKDGLLMGQLTN